MIAPIIAFRSSTRTANIFTNGVPAESLPTFTSSTSARTARYGPLTAAAPRCSSTTSTDTFSTHGGRGAIFPAGSGESTASASIRKATSMSPKWTTGGFRSSGPARERIRRFLWANRCTRPGSKSMNNREEISHKEAQNTQKILLCVLCLFVVSFPLLAQRPQTAEDVFKNVQVLKGIPVDEFISTMGIFSAALSMSCEDCHASNDTKWENYALDTSPRKRMARRMVQMVTTINKDNFGGRQMITCWTCHRGTSSPKITPNLATLYSLPDDPDDVIAQAPNAPSIDEILDKYVKALGGADRLNRLTSFVAKGTSVGYGPEGTPRGVEIYAKAQGQRTTIIHTSNGDSITAVGGRNGWTAGPLKPLPGMQLTGSAVEGGKIEAALSFSAHIKELLSQ